MHGKLFATNKTIKIFNGILYRSDKYMLYCCLRYTTPNGFSKPIIVFNKFLKNHCLYRMRCKWFEIRLYWLFGYRYQIWEFFAVFHLIYFSSIVLLPQLGFTLNHIFCKIIELWWANKLVLGFMHYWLTIL